MKERATPKRDMVRLAVSIGCPCGVGPEISVSAALDAQREDARVRCLLVGSLDALRAGARATKIDPSRLVAVTAPEDAWSSRARDVVHVYEPTTPLAPGDREPGAPTAASGAAQLAWIDAATDLVKDGRADALVTGPVSKDAIARSGARGAAKFRGHTEHLAERLGVPHVTMCFHADALVSSLVTTHLPLAKVPRAITKEGVARAIVHTAALMEIAHDEAHRRVLAVTALNPHAGENGLLGREEIDVIAPGIELARAELEKLGLREGVEGPMGAETAFRRASDGYFSAVVAMFHDQATIPMKLATWSEAVNVTLGLPIVRTSVDHGTAYDQAGKGTADSAAMRNAMRLAATLHERGRSRRRSRGAVSAGRRASTRGTTRR